MPRGNPSPKLAITVDPQVHDGVLAAAEREGVSVSAWITSAARQVLKRQEALAVIGAWEAENGAFTEQEMAQARRRVADEQRTAPARRRVRRSA